MNDSEHKQIIASNIRRLMEQRGITNQQICADLDIKYTTFVDWINAKTVPRIGKIELMANYFHVNKSDLIEDKDGPANNDAELWEIRETLRRRPEMRTLFSVGKNATADEINQTIAIIDALKKAKQ